jgi:hypothetical protein
VTRKGDRFLGDTFLKAAVTSESNDVMVENSVIGSVETGSGALSGESITDGVAHTLTERSGGGFDPFGFIKLGVARSDGVKLAEGSDVVVANLVSGKVKPAVDEHGAVTGGEDEAVAVEPLRSSGIKTETFAKKNGAQIGTSKRKTKVAGGTGMDGIDGESAGFRGCPGECFFIHVARTSLNSGTSIKP